MNLSAVTRIEALNNENYDTWRMHMEALLIKNDSWQYVNGDTVKPEATENNVNEVRAWEKNDAKAKSDIILSIGATELKQVKGCISSREVWQKLEGIYASKGPARKATLFKSLMLHRMDPGTDIRDHLTRFFDTADKLAEMNVGIDPELVSIMLLYSLPSSFENFRCAVESRDVLPTPDVLRVKIIEESDARQRDNKTTLDAMFSSKSKSHFQNKKQFKSKGNSSSSKDGEAFKFKCHKCRQTGHKAINCPNKNKSEQTPNKEASHTTMSATEALMASSETRVEKWCLDSGASSHFCTNKGDFSNISRTRNDKLNLANKVSTEIIAEGTVTFDTHVNNEGRTISLENALLVPDLRTNLLSVGKIADHGYKVLFDKDGAHVLDYDGNVKLFAQRSDGLYYVHENKENAKRLDKKKTESLSSLKIPLWRIWHHRFGHLNVKDMEAAERSGRVKGLKNIVIGDDTECLVCVKGKMTRNPFPKRSNRSSEILDLIHSDVCGPMRVESLGGAKYFVQFIDDCSRWSEIRFLKSKAEVLGTMEEVFNLIETQTERKVKCLQTDNGREYLNEASEDFLKRRGISRRLTVAYNPEQNGIAERRNRTVVEMARCLLIQSGLPSFLWAEAVNTANYIRNRCPTKSLSGKTPYEVWHQEIPDVAHFREFGCRVLILDRGSNIGKLDNRCKSGHFVGYSQQSKGYRIWLPEERKIVVSRDVKFFEGINTQASE